jgi:mannitol-specific phosphotransferase system IIBC component
LSSNPDLVLCHRGLAQRAKQAVPDIVVVPFDMFIGDIRIAKLVKSIENGSDISDD